MTFRPLAVSVELLEGGSAGWENGIHKIYYQDFHQCVFLSIMSFLWLIFPELYYYSTKFSIFQNRPVRINLN